MTMLLSEVCIKLYENSIVKLYSKLQTTYVSVHYFLYNDEYDIHSGWYDIFIKVFREQDHSIRSARDALTNLLAPQHP